MNGPTAIQTLLEASKFLMNQYLNDLGDADMLARPVPDANHLAWQMGHLITAEVGMISGQIPDAQFPELPPNFAEKHNKDTANSDDPTAFHSKEEYVSLFNQVRDTTISLVGQLSEEDLDKPTQGPMAPFAPTVGAFLILVSNHTLMHGGQASPIRRKLGKPVLF